MRRCSCWKSGRGRSFINWSLKVSSGKRWPGLTRVCRAWCVKMFCVKWSALFMKKVRLLDTRILSGLKTSENISLVGNREMEVLSSRITAEAPPQKHFFIIKVVVELQCCSSHHLQHSFMPGTYYPNYMISVFQSWVINRNMLLCGNCAIPQAKIG